MKNNAMTISFSSNSSWPDSESESVSSSDLRTNQIREHFPLTMPPSKKPRGRPPGSKNKPKLNNRPVDSSQKPIVINVPPGGDVIERIVNVADRSQVSVVILSATGTVATVTLRHAPLGGPMHVLHGPFTLMSLNGFYIYGNVGFTLSSNLSFGINLCSSQGQVLGGAVGGRVIAARDGIQVVLSPFKNPLIYQHVPQGEETDKNNSNIRSSPNN